MRRRSTPFVAATATVAALSLAGCIPTLARDEPTPTPGVQPTGAGRLMEQAALQSALPTSGEIGDSWRADDDGATSKAEVEHFDPTHCAQLARTGPGWDEVADTEHARAGAAYAQEGTSTTDFISVSIASHETIAPDELYDRAGDAVADCASFKLRHDRETWLEYQTSPLSFPVLGDRTLAYRFTFEAPTERGPRTVRLDIVAIKLGHNSVSVSHVSMDDPPDPAVTERAVRTTLTKLEQQ